MPTEPEDYYDDAPAAAPNEPTEPPGPSEEDQAKTSILPKSFFADDAKPGDKCVVEVTAVHDGDVEVKYFSKEEEPGEPEPPEAEAAAPEAPDSMAGMLG
jgi:hypothetical protein